MSQFVLPRYVLNLQHSTNYPFRKSLKMSPAPVVSEIQVENFVFPQTVKPPGSPMTIFLGGAGWRGMEIQGKFIKFTAIVVYLEGEAVPVLAVKWKGKTADELTESVEFFRDIVTGPFKKFTRVTMILPLTGQQYSGKVADNCLAAWKALGIYTEAAGEALEKFKDVFKDEEFPSGASILFTQFPSGTLTIAFTKDGSVPEEGEAVIENKTLSGAVFSRLLANKVFHPRQSAVWLYEYLNC